MSGPRSETSADTRVRTVQWGHWGITFSEHTLDEYARASYAPAVIHGTLAFPVGARGPVDSDRARYQAAIDAWKNDGVLPVFSSGERSNG